MSEPIKTNDEILADQQAFQDSYTRAQQFFGQLDGVEGVGFGYKQISAQYQETIAIVVFVREKKPAEALPPEQQIPASFEGYPTDVRVVQQTSAEACDNETRYDPIQGGIQIATPRNPLNNGHYPGTLGCIVRRRNDNGRDNVYLLTAMHVLITPLSKAGDYIYHPYQPTEGKSGGIALGPIQENPFYRNVWYTPPNKPQASFFVDAGIARIDIDSKCFGRSCTKDQIKYDKTITDLDLTFGNDIKGVRSVIGDTSILQEQVIKVGRTTGKTVGRVRLVGAAINATSDPHNPQSPPMALHNLIEIEFVPSANPNGLNCKGRARFTEPSDSGAMVLDNQNRIIGMHVRGGNPGESNELYSYSCHIMPILESLQIDIALTDAAPANLVADDSGLGPAPAGTGSAGLAAGGPALAAQAAADSSDSAPSLPEDTPASEDELHHFYMLRDQFCATDQGRALHDAFVEVRREIGYLVRNSRPVKVVWHRHKGPAFFAHTLHHLRGDTAQMPQVVDDVPLDTLLRRMRDVLSAHGSRPLRAALEAHGDQVLALVLSGTSAHDYLAHLQR